MTPEQYLERVRATVAWGGEYFTSEQLRDATSLVAHGEPAESLCALAWIIVNSGVHVPRRLIDDIRLYSADLVEDRFMPPNLQDYALPGQAS